MIMSYLAGLVLGYVLCLARASEAPEAPVEPRASRADCSTLWLVERASHMGDPLPESVRAAAGGR